MSKNNQQIAILDAGAQYSKMIDRRVRELGFESQLLPISTPKSQLKKFAAIIISGGPSSVYLTDAVRCDKGIFDSDLPILGICYGMQLLNHQLGGTVVPAKFREDGQYLIKINHRSRLFEGMGDKSEVLLTHGDQVGELAPGFLSIASSMQCVVAIEHEQKPWFGVQFHPEADLSTDGRAIFENFLIKIAKLKPDFTVEDRAQKALEEIKDQVGESKVLVLVSGGVDSTVCAALLARALRHEQIVAVHVDTGLMRFEESQQVMKSLSKLGLKPHLLEKSSEFLGSKTQLEDGRTVGPLSQTLDPQEKRKIIGNTYIKELENYLSAQKLSFDNTFLAQGTLRPDLIESASAHASAGAQVIKTHHNDTQLVRDLRDAGRVIEPLKEYHKDEVRQLGSELGLPDEIVWRQPFPGPGLAIRILCTDQNYIKIDDSLAKQVAEVVDGRFTTGILPVKTVGVHGDGRSYSYGAVLAGDKNWPALLKTAQKITGHCHQINRVVFAFGEEKLSNLSDLTPTLLSYETLNQLRAADKIVNDLLLKNDLIKKLSQVPVILLPVSFGKAGGRSIVIRTFMTNDFMTGVPATPGLDLPAEILEQMVKQILDKVPGITRVLYDLTAKPPGTTEWE